MSSSNVVNNLMKDNTFKNNGPIGNIKEVVDEKYDNLLNYSSSPNTDDLRNCNTQDQLKEHFCLCFC